jgi:hypothetical protein
VGWLLAQALAMETGDAALIEETRERADEYRRFRREQRCEASGGQEAASGT